MGLCAYCNATIWGRSKYCSKECYWRKYYEDNKERLLERRKQWNRDNYVPHPKVPKYASKEEFLEAKKEYYREHKEYYKQKAHEYYMEHKDNEEFKSKRKQASMKYIRKRYAEDEEYRERLKKQAQESRQRRKERLKKEKENIKDD